MTEDLAPTERLHLDDPAPAPPRRSKALLIALLSVGAVLVAAGAVAVVMVLTTPRTTDAADAPVVPEPVVSTTPIEIEEEEPGEAEDEASVGGEAEEERQQESSPRSPAPKPKPKAPVIDTIESGTGSVHIHCPENVNGIPVVVEWRSDVVNQRTWLSNGSSASDPLSLHVLAEELPSNGSHEVWLDCTTTDPQDFTVIVRGEGDTWTARSITLYPGKG